MWALLGAFALSLVASVALAAEAQPIDTRPDLTLGVSASPNPVPAGQQVTYTLTVRNGASSTGALTPAGGFYQMATGVRVIHNLPSGIVFQSATADSGFACVF